MRYIHVMAAVIRDAQNRILIAKRPEDAHQGGLWEFPGGKLEDGEERADGLRRELQEELGIRVTQARPLLDIRHDYPDKSVRLDVWLVTGFEGQAHGAEGQPVRWVSAAELDDYDFPAANAPIVRAAQLPEVYLITPDVTDEAELFSGLERARGMGVRLVQLRQSRLSAETYRDLAQRVLARFGDDFQWLLKGDEQPVLPGAGWHLTSRQLRQMWLQDFGPDASGQTGEARPKGRLLAASCHDAEELAMAAEVAVDFVTLSPVMPTATHPDAVPLGWELAQELIRTVSMPVYVLGGVGPETRARAFAVGAQGVAGIRRFWG
ncbi:8-oxo-dGTPase [Halopseudomonas litoralis]|uniref:8-oxo-dGTP diphosphatase n=1 Tax=Halopseudomonas litoralis TaxID=797277 RepID=A0A1H1M3N7_9GAMM|nr:Nudix family hydrolase [Halopseudomonas litoralis]SDR81413.1 8-oxo-dGTPase [Halopseudomonas litoralis]